MSSDAHAGGEAHESLIDVPFQLDAGTQLDERLQLMLDSALTSGFPSSSPSPKPKPTTPEANRATLRLLHVACDQQTRGDDPGAILCLVNKLNRSRCAHGAGLETMEQVRKATNAPQEQVRKRPFPLCDQDSRVEESHKRLKTSHGHGSEYQKSGAESVKENPDELLDPLNFVDTLDGRTPLHRVCAPPAAPTATHIAPIQVGDLSYDDDVSDLEDFDPADCPQNQREPAATQRQLQLSPATLKEQQWTFYAACLVLGLSLEMSILQDTNGETPLHLLGRHIPGGPKEEQFRRLTALSLIRASAATSECLLLMKDKEGNTPLHRSIITSINRRGAPRMMSRICPSPNPLNLFDSVLIQQCPRVLQVQNAKGLTPLHVACRHRSSSSMAGGCLSAFDLISYMARMDPHALLVQDWELGYTPLHYVCADDVSAPLLDMLLQVEEQCFGQNRPGSRALLLQDRRGFTPLHLACLDGAPLAVLSNLLQRCPSASCIRDEANSTPLHRLWAANVHTVSVFKRLLKVERATQHEMLEGTKGELWDKVRCLVWAQCHVLAPGEDGIHGTGYELHAMSGLDLPPMVLELALRLYPEQLVCPNRAGDLPLHIAARSCVLSAIPCDNTFEGVSQIVSRRKQIYQLLESGQLRLDEDTQDWRYVPASSDEESAIEESDDESTEGSISVSSAVESVSSSSLCSSTSSALASKLDFSSSCSKILGASSSFLEYSDKSPASSSSASLPSFQSGLESNNRRGSNQPALPRLTLDLILDAFPEAVNIPDGSGRHPLHLALESGKTWGNGVCALVSCSPSVLGVQDAKTGLYPFMLAASVGTTMEQCDAEARDAAEAAEELEQRVSDLPINAGATDTVSSALRNMEVARLKAAVKSQTAAVEMRRLNTVYILLSCRPELVATEV